MHHCSVGTRPARSRLLLGRQRRLSPGPTRVGFFLPLLVAFFCVPGSPLAAVSDDGATVLVRTSELLDVHTGEVLRNQDLLVRGGRIVERASNVEAPAGAEVVDLRGLFVLPGLMDAHVHLTGDASRRAGRLATA